MKRLADIMAAIPKPDGGGIPAQVACLTCSDTGFELVDVNGVKRARRCPDCLERRRGFAPGVPDDEQLTTLDSYGSGKGDLQTTSQNDNAIRQARFFVDDVHPGLYLHGGVGTGKTTLACAVLNMMHRKGLQVRFVRVTELLRQLVVESGDAVYQRMVDLPVLCLDDVGAQKGSDYARQTMQVIFDKRMDTRRRTIWTSNLSLDDLSEFFADERLASRIAGNAKVVLMDGTDYRLKTKRRAK